MSVDKPPFASGMLDRDATTRMSSEALEAAWAEPEAGLLRLRGVEAPVVAAVEDAAIDGAAGAGFGGARADGFEAGGSATGGRGYRLALTPVEGSFETVGDDGRVGHVYLGRAEGRPVFGVAAAPGDEPPAGAEWRHPFEVGFALSEVDRELLGVASALLRWHESSRFSPRDGRATAPALGGWARHDEHGGEHFPRTDPAVIVLIEHDDRVLLGSNALWETGRFSLLAGFVEAGESLEQTVVREVFEEAGVRLGEVEYVASQPWPFPRSLMLGFRARLAPGADPEELTPDPEEISELRWFTREQVRHPEPGIRLPAGASIARWMLDRWVAEGDGAVGLE
ncbi:NAD(+) diphosphatase [Leucobacter ruminantium]|uniref:NAD(+) diphosphatase n=1 Tax=Leucobacter ruminantium TaxID=1289170 RepID=A0A939LWM1_9MICO|nr:NAD(+) diphosphatase [Leucobacter ruminantium]MBO1806134.1 NAD(+) diphosphatase [Leucobacter ruminantium]